MAALQIGILAAIAVRPARGEPMRSLGEVTVTAGRGIDQERRRRGEKRQVTLLSQQQWDAVCEAMGRTVNEMPWTTHRANLLIDCAALAALVPNTIPAYAGDMRFPDRRPREPQAGTAYSLMPLIGRRLRVGDVVLEPTVETKPCSHIDALTPGLRAALLPDGRGGVCCRVHTAGVLRPGEPVCLISRDEDTSRRDAWA